MKFKFLLPILTFSFLLCTAHLPLNATPTNKAPSEQIGNVSPVEAKLISENHSIKPGEKFWIGIQLKMADGWDTYWINPGDAGFPTNVKWDLPKDFQISSLQWPYPEKFTSQSLVGFGYTHSVLLLAEVTPSSNLPLDKNIDIKADVSWLACKEQCVPGKATLTLTLPVKGEAPKKDDTVASQFLKGRELIPQKSSPEGLTVAADKGDLIVNFNPGSNDFREIGEAVFIPEVHSIIDYNAPQLLNKVSQGYNLKVKRAEPSADLAGNVKGVLVISDKTSGVKKAIQVDAPLNGASHLSSNLRFEIALVFAFLGGLILNVMPCVLPVISLKIFSFIKMAQERRGEIFRQGMLFTSGVLISFWVLATLLLILRASGEGIGWGFQLQEPMFVTILILVLFLLGLSLFGLFEFGTSLMSVGNQISSKGSFFKGSFMNGVLATLMATPCTGPLLGPALGLAMTLPFVSSIAIFTAMGLGMASPYLIISAFPKLIRFLPKPGNWMIVFKQLMGFLMMGTCAWLIWVFAGQTDHMALFVLLFVLLLFSIGAWIYGKWATLTAKKTTRILATSLSAVILLFGGGMALTTVNGHRATAIEHTQGGDWESFSSAKIDALRKEGKPVFVDFTAKWCLICQANKVILHSSEISKAFKEKNVVTMEADWTMKDERITTQLRELGRSGVPVYVLYPADPTQPPYILPQTLTKSTIQEYLKKLDSTTVQVDKID